MSLVFNAPLSITDDPSDNPASELAPVTLLDFNDPPTLLSEALDPRMSPSSDSVLNDPLMLFGVASTPRLSPSSVSGVKGLVSSIDSLGGADSL